MKTFAGIAQKYADYNSAEVILQSVPYDGTSTWGKGADKGFDAFLEAAENMELYDIETDSEVYQRGIYLAETLTGFNSAESMFDATYQNAKKHIQSGKLPTFFGGEHSISIGIIKAFYEHYENLTVLQIDAHTDLRPSYEGTPYNHACAVFDASQNCNLIQVGIRSMDISELSYLNRDKCFFADQIHDNKKWMEKSIALMTDNVYITFDLDAFDPSIMPATGTPEPGGLLWYPTLEYLKKVFEKKKVVGFDLVELAPIAGLHAPQFLTSKLYYKMLSYNFKNEK